MATKTIAFRLNPKNREDKEILDWLDSVVCEDEIYDSITEAVKWAVLSFVRGEARNNREAHDVEVMQGFIREFAKESKADNEKIMQDAVTRILATIVGTIGQQVYGYMPAPMQMVRNASATAQGPITSGLVEAEAVEEVAENNLEFSDEPLDKGAIESLTAMFGDDED